MSKSVRIEYIKTNRTRFTVKAMCRVLGVSEAGYYKHLRQPIRESKHAILLAQIYKLIAEDAENANYGVQRIYMYLQINNGYTGGKRTIYRICKENNLMIRCKHQSNGISKADADAQKSENLIAQNFSAKLPNTKWLTDITEVPCKDGKLYLCAVLDCFDGMIVGFAMDDNMRAELCIDAFQEASRHHHATGMILHSDRGSQFTSHKFRCELKKKSAVQSMSGTGRCYDNARMESFFATLKKESLYRMKTSEMKMKDVKSIIFRFIHYYNLRRIYSTNGGFPPAVFRKRFYASIQVA